MKAPDPETHSALAFFLQDLRNDPPPGTDLQLLEEVTHRDVVTAAQDARIPAERINNRWYYRRTERQRIAEILCLMQKPRIGRPSRQQVASSLNSTVAA